MIFLLFAKLAAAKPPKACVRRAKYGYHCPYLRRTHHFMANFAIGAVQLFVKCLEPGLRLHHGASDNVAVCVRPDFNQRYISTRSLHFKR